jgi:hypothetical protein
VVRAQLLQVPRVNKHVPIFVMCVFHGHSVTTDPCSALCVWSIPKNISYIVIENNAEKYSMLSQFDGDVCLENEASRDIHCVTFSTCFLTRNYTMESLCANVALSFIFMSHQNVGQNVNIRIADTFFKMCHSPGIGSDSNQLKLHS